MADGDAAVTTWSAVDVLRLARAHYHDGVDQPGRAAQRGLLPGPTPSLVWGRAAVLGSLGFASGVVSHAVAGGTLPGPVALLTLLGACVLIAAPVLRRRASAPVLALGVLVFQTGVHAVLSAVAGHRGGHVSEVAQQQSVQQPPVPFPVQGGGTLLEQYRASAETVRGPEQDWLAHQLDHFVAQGPAMMLAHFAAAVALGLFLFVGEDALWRLLALAAARTHEWVHRGLRARARLAAVLGSRREPAALLVGVEQVFVPQVLGTPVERRRGPPVVLAA